jgi:hypothetical protein
MKLGASSRAAWLLAVVLAAFWRPSATVAAWSPFVELGKSGVNAAPMLLLSDPSCATSLLGSVVCAALGPEHIVYTIEYSKGAWGAWTPRGTFSSSAPSCGPSIGTPVFCVSAKPSIGTMVAEIDRPVGFATEVTVTASDLLATPPSCARLDANTVFCGATTQQGHIVGAEFLRSSSTGFIATDVAGDRVFHSPLSCASEGRGNVICAWLGDQSHVLASEYFPAAAGASSGWVLHLDLGGFATSTPQCIYSRVVGSAACFATDALKQLGVNQYTADPQKPDSFGAKNWSGWRGLDGLVGGFGCTGSGIGLTLSYICGAVSLGDNAFYTNENDGTGWKGWVLHGGSFTGNPACFLLSEAVLPVKVMCVVRSVNLVAMSTIGP